MYLLKIEINYTPKKQFSTHVRFSNSIQKKCVQTTNGAIFNWLIV